MILKQLRLSQHLSQEQLAEMSGLSVRTIQRVENGSNASLESQKCLAAALNVDIDTLNQEALLVDKNSDNWRDLPIIIKLWFSFNFLQLRPIRSSANRMIVISHLFGFFFCSAGVVSEPALIGGLIMLANGYLFSLLRWQGDKYDVWYEQAE